MNDIRSEISDIQFPLKSDTSYEVESKTIGTKINKKIKQYVAVYNETKKFLRFLYLAIVVAFLIQLFFPLISFLQTGNSVQLNLQNLTIAAVIFILLLIAMKIFILSPEKIRSFAWLSSVGIQETYTRDIFNPKIELNVVPKNLKKSNNFVTVDLSSDIALYGYNLLLTIENLEGNRLYHVVGGRVQKRKYLGTGSNFYTNGRSRSILNLIHSLKLKPGRYNVRLLFFETTYPGTNSPSETQVELEITTQIAKMAQSNINLHKRNSGFTYQCSKNSPKRIEFSEDIENIDAIRELLSTERFTSLFNKSKLLFSISNENGMLNSDRIHRSLTPSRILRKKIIYVLRKKFSKKTRDSTHINLT